MTRIITITILFWAIISSVNAQFDQISVGANYSNQAYYSLSTGEVEIVENDAWDIAFSASGQLDAGVLINESATFMSAPMQVFLANTSDWAEDISDIQYLNDSLVLYNPELNWTEGAFNTVKDETDPFDYGWGAYNPQTHVIEGNRIFIIKLRDGSHIKFFLSSLSGGTYSFQYANLDGSQERSYEISKDAADSGLAYFSFFTEKQVDMPTEYDLVFQRYSTPLDAGGGVFIPYTVTGVLLAPGVEAAVATGIDPSTINEADYTSHYSSLPTTIGHTWKYFDFQSGWVIDDQRSHFVKDINGSTYQVTFLDFEGSSTGITTIEKTLITSVSTSENEALDVSLTIFPNPSSEYFVIKSDVEEELSMQMFNRAGQLVRSQRVMTNTDIDLNTIDAGWYSVMVRSKSGLIYKNMIVR